MDTRLIGWASIGSLIFTLVGVIVLLFLPTIGFGMVVGGILMTVIWRVVYYEVELSALKKAVRDSTGPHYLRPITDDGGYLAQRGGRIAFSFKENVVLHADPAAFRFIPSKEYSESPFAMIVWKKYVPEDTDDVDYQGLIDNGTLVKMFVAGRPEDLRFRT